MTDPPTTPICAAPGCSISIRGPLVHTIDLFGEEADYHASCYTKVKKQEQLDKKRRMEGGR